MAGSIQYPDALVVCSPTARGATVITEPVVVFEVLSPSTASVDHIVKNREYRDTPSIRRYVMLEQDRRGATIFSRDGDDWVGHVLAGDVALALPEIGIELPLAELYEGVLVRQNLKLRPEQNPSVRTGAFAPLEAKTRGCSHSGGAPDVLSSANDPAALRAATAPQDRWSGSSCDTDVRRG